LLKKPKISIPLSLCLFFVYSILFQNVYSQEELGADTTKILKHLRAASSQVGVNNNKVEEHLKKAEKIILAIDFNSKNTNKGVIYSVGQFHAINGYLFYNRNSLTEALQSFRQAELLFEKSGSNTEHAECLNNSAVILNTLGNNVEAINSYHKSISLYEKLDDIEGKAYAFNNVSRIYRQQGSFGQAMEYINQSLHISEVLNNKNLESLSLNSKAGLLKVTGDTIGAIAAYQKALSIRKELLDSVGIASVLNNIGSIFKGQKKYDLALNYFYHAKDIASLKGFKAGIGHTNNNIGEVYFKLKKYSDAEENGRSALKIAKEIDLLSLKRQSAELLMDIYQATERWKEAFEMQELVLDAKDLLVNQETKQIAQRESMRYEFEKERALDKKEEEQHIQLQKEKSERQQIYYVSIGLIALLLLVLLFFVINRLRSAKEQNKLILKQSNERKLLLQEVHHRVKNNFQIVSSLLRLQSYSIDDDSLRNSFEEAVSRINSMAIVHDIIYRQETFSAIDSKEYLEKLIKTLQKTSGDPNIDIVIRADRPKLKIETLIHLGIALNELVINSFKYAFNDIDEKPKIQITLNEVSKQRFELIYQDNGIGLNKELSKSSFGMELVETLIEHLDGEVEFKNLENWKTTIILRFSDI